MFFIILTFCAALFIEGLGSLVSVIGISALFGANLIIIALAIALDVGKVVTVSLLYSHWQSLSKLMKSYALLAAAVTMIITSAGAAGYLSGEFQKAILGTKEGEVKLAVLKEQQLKYQERKKQIDDQIAALPEKTTVNQRLRLMNGFKAEQKSLDEKISQIDKELPALQISQLGTEAKAGPIVTISKAFKIPVEEAIWYVIGMIIFVFDPLAIFLIIAGNFLWAKHKSNIQAVKQEPIVTEEVVDINQQTIHQEKIKDVILTQEPVVYEKDTSSQEEVLTPDPEVYVEDNKIEEEKPVEEKPKFVQSGLLKPIETEDDNKEEIVNVTPSEFIPLEVPSPKMHAGPIQEDELKEKREEITRSTLGLVPADPNTIVDAHNNIGFRKAASLKPTIKK